MKNTFVINIVIIFILTILSVYFFSTIVIYILVALTISTILRVPINHLNRINIAGYYIPFSLNIIALISGIIFSIWTFTRLLAPLIQEEYLFISSIDFKNLVDNIEKPISYIEHFLIGHLPLDQEPGFLLAYFKTIFQDFSQILGFSFTNTMALVNTILSFTGSLLTGILTVTFIVIFLIYEKNLFQRAFMRFIPNRYFEITSHALVDIELQLSNYLRGLFIQMLCIFSVCWLGFMILGSEHALLIAIFTALANFIPFLGPLIGSIIGISIEFSTNMNLHAYQDYSILFLKIVIIFGSIQLMDNVLFQPLIFSKSNNTHPLQIFLAIIAGAIIAGIVGMIAAIPGLIVLKILYQKYLDLKHAAVP